MVQFAVRENDETDFVGLPYAPPRDDSVIDPGLTVTGNVSSKGTLRVDGTVRGDVDCTAQTASEGGRVEGAVAADNVVIRGDVDDSILGRSVILHVTAKVTANVAHQGVAIEMGTHCDGSMKRVDDAEFEQRFPR